MNIEYEVTVDDDINAIYTNWLRWLKEGKIAFIPARYFPVFICVMSVSLIIWGLFETVREDRYVLFFGGGFLLFISILLFFLYKPKSALSSFSRREIEKEHKKYSPNQEQRNLVLTAEEFIVKTGFSETA